jgi:hypothetical protein
LKFHQIHHPYLHPLYYPDPEKNKLCPVLQTLHPSRFGDVALGLILAVRLRLVKAVPLPLCAWMGKAMMELGIPTCSPLASSGLDLCKVLSSQHLGDRGHHETKALRTTHMKHMTHNDRRISSVSLLSS